MGRALMGPLGTHGPGPWDATLREKAGGPPLTYFLSIMPMGKYHIYIYIYIYTYADNLLLDDFVKSWKGVWLGGSSPDFHTQRV